MSEEYLYEDEINLSDESYGIVFQYSELIAGVRMFPKALCERLEKLESRHLDQELVEFARKVIASFCWGYDCMDGLDIQDLAEKLNLIVPHIATKDDVDEESDYEVGDRIYIFSEALQKHRKEKK